MHVAVLLLRFRLPSRTLKEKRAIVKPALERARSRFNASLAELDDLDTPGLATLGAACLSNDARQAESQAQSIANTIEGWRLDAELLDVHIEVIPL